MSDWEKEFDATKLGVQMYQDKIYQMQNHLDQAHEALGKLAPTVMQLNEAIEEVPLDNMCFKGQGIQ